MIREGMGKPQAPPEPTPRTNFEVAEDFLRTVMKTQTVPPLRAVEDCNCQVCTWRRLEESRP
jgi:hypothetical protein